MSRIETANSISKQDTALIQQVVGFQHQIVHRRTLLRNERARQHRLVAARAAERNQIEGRLASERHLYSSVRSQIQQLISAQQAQQAAAARAARVAAQTAGREPEGQLRGRSREHGSVAGARYSGVVGHRDAVPRRPVRLGRREPERLRLLGSRVYVYAQVGVSLPHYTVAQYNYADSVSVSRSQLQPGDLVFFDGLGHVGIYVGNGQFIHAPHTGSVVRIDSLSGWYASEYDGAKRILG